MTAAPLLSVDGIVIGGNAVSFEMHPGEVLAVLGSNGAGKSLLLACLSGHLLAPTGTVSVNGHQPHRARCEIGVMFQHHALLRNMTVFENVALPFLVDGLVLREELEKQVLLRLQLVGCGHLANQDVQHLSEGDKRCVALARALSGHPRLLIADEPVAALAPAKKALVEEFLASLVRQSALSGIVLATQDVEFAGRVATHYLILETGGHALVPREDALRDPCYKAFVAPQTS